jgi:hypothetical protein
MRIRSVVIAFLIAFFISGPVVLADPPAPGVAGDTGAETMSPEAVTADVTPLLKGKPAPHSGLLVLEGRFTKMLEAELTAKSIGGTLEIERKLRDDLESLYTRKLEEATKPEPWYKSGWIYFGLGVLVTVGALYGGAQLVKAID